MSSTVSVGLVIAAASLGVAATCPKGQKLTGLEIVPERVVVGSDLTTPTTFELEARAWVGPTTDRRTAVASKDYGPLKWSDDQSWLHLGTASGLRVQATVDPGTGTGTPAEVKVEAGGLTATATIEVVPPGSAGKDIVNVMYNPGSQPGAAVVSGVPQGSTSGCDMRLAALVRRATLGNFASSCAGALGAWEVAVADPDYNAVFPAGGWTSGDDAVAADAEQKSRRVLPVALRIMVGTTSTDAAVRAKLQTDALKIAQLDVIAANSILAETRAGVELLVKDEQKIAVTQPVLVADCAEGDLVTAPNDLHDVLNVYYVNGMYSQKGKACTATDARPWDVLYIGYDLHSTTSLVHELGHAMGLMLPGQGHSEILAGLDISNVMNGWDEAGEPGGRRRLSVGQVFRVNAEAASWLNRAVDGGGNLVREVAAPRVGCQCGAHDPPGPCPTLARDVAAPSLVPSTTNDWDCVDLLYLKKVTDADDEHPVALARGRGWRQPLGTCPTDLPGREERHWHATYIRLDNLGRQGTCQSWAAIFFRRHGPIHFWIPGGALTAAADQITLDLPMPPPIIVRLDVYFPASEQGTVDQDLLHLGRTFSEDNHTGVTLDVYQHPDVLCPTTSPGDLEVALCYGAATGPEATLTPPRLITLHQRNATTASHYLGLALEIKPLPAGQVGFLNNIMHSDVAKRGTVLTLGQVFRLHKSLGATLPACDPGPCPSLEAVVP
jgi:hypothetical protein